MPRNRRSSFLTKQKEQQRRAKANEKREARRARRKARATTAEADEGVLVDVAGGDSAPADASSTVE